MGRYGVAATRIFICCEEETYTDLYQSSLEDEGYQVSCSVDLEDAAEHIEIEGCDLVVADAAFGIESLLQFWQRVLTVVPGARLVGIAADRASGAELKEALAPQQTLVKPFSILKLICAVESALLEGPASDEEETPTPRATEAPPDAPAEVPPWMQQILDRPGETKDEAEGEAPSESPAGPSDEVVLPAVVLPEADAIPPVPELGDDALESAMADADQGFTFEETGMDLAPSSSPFDATEGGSPIVRAGSVFVLDEGGREEEGTEQEQEEEDLRSTSILEEPEVDDDYDRGEREALIGQLRRKLDEARMRNREIAAELGKRERQEAKIEDLKSLVKRKEKELILLRGEVKALGDELERASVDGADKARRHQSILDNLSKENAELLRELEKRVIQHSKQLELLNSDSGQVTTVYEEKLTEIEAESEIIRNRLKASSKEKAELVRQHEELVSSLEKRLQRREEELETIESEHGRAVEDLEMALAEAEQRLGESQSQLKSVEEERDELVRDSTQAQSSMRETSAERRKVETLLAYQQNIVANIYGGFVAIDNKGKITLANPGAAELLGVPLGKILGKNIDQVPALVELRPLFMDTLQGGKALRDAEVEVTRPDGIRRALYLRSDKVKFGQKDVVMLSFTRSEKATIRAQMEEERQAEMESLACFGAGVAGNVVEVKEFLIAIRGKLEQIYSTVQGGTPVQEKATEGLALTTEAIDYLKGVIEEAERILAGG